MILWVGERASHSLLICISSVQSLSRVWLCDPMDYSTRGLHDHHQLPKFTQTHVHRVSDAIQHHNLCHPLFLLPSIIPSIRVFSNESTLRKRWPKYWSFSFSISSSNEYSGLISFRMDWLDLFSVQGTLKCLLQPHSSKASILWLSAFFTVQLSHPYMTVGKTLALTRQNFLNNVMSLLFNILSGFLIASSPKEQVSFNFMAAVTICSDFGAQENSLWLFPLFPHLFAMKWWDWSHDICFLNVEF